MRELSIDCQLLGGGRERRYPWKNLVEAGWGWVACFSKLFPYPWPESMIFSTLSMTRQKIWYPIYDHCNWHSHPKHNFRRAFVYDLINNKEKVASSKQLTQFKSRVKTTIPCLRPNGQNQYPMWYISDQNSWKPTPFGAACTYIKIQYLRVSKTIISCVCNNSWWSRRQFCITMVYYIYLVKSEIKCWIVCDSWKVCSNSRKPWIFHFDSHELNSRTAKNHSM